MYVERVIAAKARDHSRGGSSSVDGSIFDMDVRAVRSSHFVPVVLATLLVTWIRSHYACVSPAGASSKNDWKDSWLYSEYDGKSLAYRVLYGFAYCDIAVATFKM